MALTQEGIVDIPGLMSRWVKLANGAKAHYMTAGDTGPAVILLHGGAAGSSGTAGWRFMAPFLGANGFRVYCPDQPGFGLADTRENYWPKDGILSHVQFIHDFADALCLDEFHIAGNSMGCVNAIHYMLTHPTRVKSFAVIAGHIGNLVAPENRPKNLIDINIFDGSEATMRKLMEYIILDPSMITQDLMDMRVGAGKRQWESYQAWFWAFRGRTQAGDPPGPKITQWLTTKGRLNALLDIPGIYLYGRKDVLLPLEYGFAQEDVLPMVQFFYPEETGHQGQTDQPEMFGQAFLEFFRDGKVRRKTADWAGVSDRRPELAHLVEQAQEAATHSG
jgi:2-hydroxy-6-oxonona-2,4-dienedioate hydrolase